MNQKLALGTVQFGLDYGVSNKTGRVTDDEISKIFDTLIKNRIRKLDTSSAYGISENILGKFLSSKKGDFLVISKYVATEKKSPDICLQETLERLKVKKLYGYLVHHFNDLLAYNGLWEQLEYFKQTGYTDKAGFSLYYPSELEYLIQKKIKFDIVQIPYNLFDRRFEVYFPWLKENDVEIHVRSVFLQGLFFKKPDELSQHFSSVKDKFHYLQDLEKRKSIPITSIALNFAINNKFVDNVIIGVDSNAMLEENIQLLDELDDVKLMERELFELIVQDEKILLPFNWGK